MRKKWRIMVSISVATMLILSVVVAGCAPTPEATTYHWRWAELNPADSSSAQSAQRVIDEIYEKSGGRIDIDLYPGQALGDWISVCGEMRRGTIEMQLICLPTDYDPRINVVYFPLLTTNWVEAKDAYSSPDGWLYGLLDDLMMGTGIKLLGSWPMGFGCCSFVKELPPSPMDPDVDKKMKMRVWPCKSAELWASRMGYIPTPTTWAELFTAMQTGVVDTEVGGTPYLNWAHIRDVSKYLIWYKDHMEAWFFMISKTVWDELSAEDQQIILDACTQETIGRFEVAEDEDLEYLQKFRDYGTEVLIPTDAEIKKMQQAIRTDVWTQLIDVVGSDIVDFVIANAPK